MLGSPVPGEVTHRSTLASSKGDELKHLRKGALETGARGLQLLSFLWERMCLLNHLGDSLCLCYTLNPKIGWCESDPALPRGVVTEWNWLLRCDQRERLLKGGGEGMEQAASAFAGVMGYPLNWCRWWHAWLSSVCTCLTPWLCGSAILVPKGNYCTNPSLLQNRHVEARPYSREVESPGHKYGYRTTSRTDGSFRRRGRVLQTL